MSLFNNFIHRWLLLVVMVMAAGTSVTAARETWSLERCIDYALENNIMIKQQELNTRFNENILMQSRMNRLPTANANTQQSFNYGRALDFRTNTTSH